MRRSQRFQHWAIVVTMLFGCSLAGQQPVRADVSSAPSLIISHVKITSSDGQFITLYNATATALDVSKYQLQYFNHYDLSKATSSRTLSLSGVVPSHGYYMINDSTLQVCYQQVVNSISLGFSSTAGMIEVLGVNQAAAGGSVTPVLQDYMGWSKTAATGAQTLPASTSAFLKRYPLASTNNPVISTPGTGTWQTVQPDATNPCTTSLVNSTGAVIGTAAPSSSSLLLPTTEPEATTITAEEESGDTAAASLPAADIGLRAPLITEILPNPVGTGNDSEDEFIELYNPNARAFDISGFKIQVGASTFHYFTFPGGATLRPLSFTAFYSSDTGLSLSNTSGRVVMLGPDEGELASTDTYIKAADGQAWALANGTWHWTTRPSPNAANIIAAPVAKKAKKVASPQKASPKTKASATKKTAKIITPASSTASFSDEPSKTPIHAGVLALVGVGAILYGAYEYRADLGNHIYQFRRYLSARRTYRQ